VTELPGPIMRTITFGDRTISYDTGLDMLHNTGPTRSLPTERKVSVPYSEADSGAGSDCSEDHEEVDNERKLIKPDMMAISQLLNFDEEEEDDLTDSDSDESEDNSAKQNFKWQKAIVKDLASLTNGDTTLKRRHSISKCESVILKPESRKKSPTASSKQAFPVGPSAGAGVPTLNLSLSEVGHIRSVLVRAEIEALPIEENVKQGIEQGKICTVCTNTKFGMFRRGQKCEVCQQTVCFKCYSRMRIPEEQFSAIPVEVLSPVPEDDSSSPTAPSSLCFSELSNCAGSAPNTPKTRRRDFPLATLSAKQLLCEQLNSLPAPSTSSLPPLSPPLVTSKYSTLPKMAGRRWSMISAREKDREKLEGSLLTVCTNCNDMVKQVIRSSGVNRRAKQGSIGVNKRELWSRS